MSWLTKSEADAIYQVDQGPCATGEKIVSDNGGDPEAVEAIKIAYATGRCDWGAGVVLVAKRSDKYPIVKTVPNPDEAREILPSHTPDGREIVYVMTPPASWLGSDTAYARWRELQQQLEEIKNG